MTLGARVVSVDVPAARLTRFSITCSQKPQRQSLSPTCACGVSYGAPGVEAYSILATTTFVSLHVHVTFGFQGLNMPSGLWRQSQT